MAAAANDVDVNLRQHHSMFADGEVLSAPDEEDEADLEPSEVEGPEEAITPVVTTTTTTTPMTIRPVSNLSTATTSTAAKKRASQQMSRPYRFVQLERALHSGGLLTKNEDREAFEQNYLEAIRLNTFDQFLHDSYKKLHDHHVQIKQQRDLKQARTFTFVDLVKNFLALDPSRDIKIEFIDSIGSSSTVTNTSVNQYSTVSELTDDSAVEEFYAHRSRRLLHNPARARDEITLFARRAGERLHERLPRLSSVPHRVKVVDERDTTGKPDERTLLQMKHKRALSLIARRRHLLLKMMTQTQRNQNKMEKHQLHERRTQMAMNSSCCRELLERASQIEQAVREEETRRPQTAAVASRGKKTRISSAQSQVTSTSVTTSSSSPFVDILSMHHLTKATNIRVLVPARPLTAPLKSAWVNYC